MAYDLLVKGGTVVDGSGLARYRADVAVKDGKIAAIGRMNGVAAKETVNADGLVVSPGFVDGHTHMDAQIFWDPHGTCSCYHGVTTVVMGNCGFTLAPCKEQDADLVIRNLEKAEDISRNAMLAGIKWSWETFGEYFDTLDKLPQGINYSGYMGHSALRTYVMGESAFERAATDDEIKKMKHEMRESLKAGAIGFSTSRSAAHETPDGRPVASRMADWREVQEIVGTMAEMNSGIFELAAERLNDPKSSLPVKDLAVQSGRPITQGIVTSLKDPTNWIPMLDMMEDAAKQGARMSAQVQVREIAILLSFETALSFDHWDGWREFRAQPLDQQRVQLRDPKIRARLVDIASKPYQGPEVEGPAGRPPDWEWIYPLYSMAGPNPSLAQLARERGVKPVEVMIDEALKHDFKLFFRQVAVNGHEDELLKLIRHPRAVVTLSDSGAHVSQIMDNSMQTHMLAYWVRQKQAFTLEEAVRKMSYETATHWGFADRGLIREGFAADMIIFDPNTIAAKMPELRHDLPTGAPRLFQGADGLHATIVNGAVVLRNGVPTGNLPGRLLRAKVPG
jgi:N-acyl-D-aspartate/D-glutamate deacylase